ncbi:endonuclease/exonuclease/phosphatase family protein [Pseudoalteromonas haloplanktis]|uniref:Endonuclease/exonuclease/phosphatase family protein n=1 Tax=Pseudoalteromonas haloplanktis TaxID=228 RepID=A0ABU1BD93_PSEHA|nr:endonuclease/exonuclease/phosphatase family protein [Pseudoalteromonas haloplanktis]MDQ9092350.1 endonuclease/exonuclease/phosphatase family protein [Pseudoalteromonas haloplanktis]
MLILLAIISTILLIASVLPLSYSQHYMVRGGDFIRLQVCYGALINLLLIASYAVLVMSSPLLIVLVIANVLVLILQGYWIYPYCWFARHEVKNSHSHAPHSIRIMSANVLMSNHNSEALISLVKQHQPDLLITLETDTWWQNQLAALHNDYPYRIACPKDNRYGMHVFSKYKIIQSQVCELVSDDIPSIHILFENADGLQMQGHFIHPEPPSPTEKDTSRTRDSELIIVAKAVKDPIRPVIVAGDLNDVAWSRTTQLFMKLSGFLDPRKGRGFFNTFHADYFFMRWPLDHLFHSPGFTVKRIKRLAKYGSDHFALLTELVYEDAEQQSLLKKDEDTAEIAEQLKMNRVDKRQVPIFKKGQ